MEPAITESFAFDISPTYTPVLLPLGVTAQRAVVEVDTDRLRARFGFFQVTTSLDNIAGVERHSGPFNPLKAIGIRYSFKNGSITFGSSTGPMVEISFHEPVTVTPPGLTHHPSLWLSVSDPKGLERAVKERGALGSR